MKLLNTTSTAALAGLLLLMPAAFGAEYYECWDGEKFPAEQITHLASRATVGRKISNGPDVPYGQNHKTRKFTRVPSGVITTYLIQVDKVDSSIRLFELTSSQWSACGLQSDYQQTLAWRKDIFPS
ncbi:BgtE-5783 [Blumeria graminis f. sp. tritici]|uniref:BgtE-5783 n=1 Tax=Blumeria graminis f. sp. tritici TaxID=62690 RepID=A0A9X9MPX0_BLUGR|nr:BgtE-5783 [Blumeria graminis f. sp. tritici]